MPSLRILTWNSNGGAPPKGGELAAAANQLAILFPTHPLLGAPNIFPNFEGFSNNLSHIITCSPSSALAATEGKSGSSPNSSHDLISARIIW